MFSAFSPRRFTSVESLEPRRLLAAGALDPAFSFDGVTSTNPPGESFVTEDLCLQADGKTIVVGNTHDPMVARFNVDGSLDTGFGFSGFFRLTGMLRARAVAMSGNSIIVVGDANGGVDITHPAAARITPSGFLDTNFGSGGYRVVDVPGHHSHANELVVQQDQRIVLVGSSRIGDGSILLGDDDFIAVRLLSDGTVDTPFGGGDGVTQLDFTGGRDEAWCVALDYTLPVADPKYGSIFLAGFRKENETRFAVAKLSPAGIPDNSFDGNGLLTTVFSGKDYAFAHGATVQPGSKLVLTGDLGEDGFFGTQRNFGTIRYLANGAIDTSFGPGGTGYVETDLSGADIATGIAVNYNGGLTVSGQSNGRVALVCYSKDGVIDSRFGGGDGIQVYTQSAVSTPFGDTTGNVKVVVTGNTINPIRRVLTAGGVSAMAIRVFDVAPAITVTALDTEASESVSNTASIRIRLDVPMARTLRVFLGVGGPATPPDDDRGTNNQDYNATNIVFGNGFATPTYVDVPAGIVAVTSVITAVDDTLAEGDETSTFSILQNPTYDVGSPTSASIIIRDNEPPAAPFTVSKAFHFETLPLQATFTFSQNVGASLSIADFVFSAGLPTPTFSYNAGLNTATLSWPVALPDGTHNVRVKASGVTNSSGTHLNADSVNAFFALAGDANRDRKVDVGDLGILATNWQKSPRTFSQADFNYDGTVNVGDLGILATNWQKSLPTLPTAPAGPGVIRSTVLAGPEPLPPLAWPVRRTMLREVVQIGIL